MTNQQCHHYGLLMRSGDRFWSYPARIIGPTAGRAP